MPPKGQNRRGGLIDPALYYAKVVPAWIGQVHLLVRNKRVEELGFER
jgi:hypothetical protein